MSRTRTAMNRCSYVVSSLVSRGPANDSRMLRVAHKHGAMSLTCRAHGLTRTAESVKIVDHLIMLSSLCAGCFTINRAQTGCCNFWIHRHQDEWALTDCAHSGDRFGKFARLSGDRFHGEAI